VPQGVGFEAAALAEPIACCLHGLDLAGIALGERVAIIGAGWIGLIMLQLARLRGAGFVSISEKIAAKRELAERLAADRVVDPQAEDYAAVVREATGGGADVVIECVGSAPTAAQALTLVRDGGTVLLFGVAPQEAEIAVRPFEIYRRELRLIGSFSTPCKHAAAIALLAGGRLEIEPLITGRFGLEGAGEAMEALESGKAIKSLIVNDE
jgi:threonine dehydrogenase-like Zn-dependent dehydrogenase